MKVRRFWLPCVGAFVQRLWSGFLAGTFYAALFFIVYCGGVIFFMPILLTVNFCLSIIPIVQSLVRFDPFSPKRRVGRLLVGWLIQAQGIVQRGIMAWAGLVHLSLIFPISMILFFVVLPIISASMNLYFVRLGTVWIVNSVVWLWHCAGQSIQVFLFAGSGLSSSLLSTFSAIVWSIINSSSFDVLVLCSIRISAKAGRLLRWIQSLLAVVVITPSIYFGSNPNDTRSAFVFFHSQLRLWLLPLGFLPFFVHQLKRASSESAYSDKQYSNASVYGSLSVIFHDADTNISGGTRHGALIRLLTIEPGTHEQPVTCHLEVADLSSPERPRYEALSYFWGPPNLAKTIEINASTFAVSTTLLHALLHLRHPQKGRTIWVDAICINQADLAERSAQVLLMQQIYSKASSMVLWLGDVEPWGLKNLIETTNTTLDMVNSIHYGAVRVISDLLQRPWWTRAWVTQELLLAQDVRVYCGSQVISWDCFSWIVDNSASLPLFPIGDVNIEEFRALRDHRKALLPPTSKKVTASTESENEAGQQESRATDLLSLIYDFRSRQATDPRDKVFAFQGLARHMKSTSLASDKQIDLSILLVRPDYSRRSSLMCIDLARRHVRRTHSLSVVALAECARQTYPLMPDTTNDNRAQYIPSWCPAFMMEAVNEGLQSRPFWTGLPGEEDRGYSSAGKIPIRVLPPKPDSLSVPTDWEHLDLDGYAAYGGYPHKLDIQILPQLCEKIIETGPVAGGSIKALIQSTMKVISRQSSTTVDSLQSRNAWDAVLPAWRRMALEAYKNRELQLKDRSFEEEYHLSITAGRFSGRPFSDSERSNHTSRPAAKPASKHMENEAYLAAREAACASRVFFTTMNGYFGIGPPDLQVGDEVCVVLGMQVPAVLRKVSGAEGRDRCLQYSEDDWLYIGQAYMHRVMVYQGNLSDDIVRGRAPVETRVLT